MARGMVFFTVRVYLKNNMAMRFDTISLFPNSLDGYLNASILGRAQRAKLITIYHHDLRKWSGNKHRRVDDTPYGGGPGMVIRVDVVHRALKAIYKQKQKNTRVILLTPRGRTFDERKARRLMCYDRLILIAGRYEAVDVRIDHYVDEKISIGNFVLTGGELAAACIIDSVSRLLPGVVGRKESITDESFARFHGGTTNIEYPQYTKPEVYMNNRVPKVLLSGNHGAIAAWRRRRTRTRRV